MSAPRAPEGARILVPGVMLTTLPTAATVDVVSRAVASAQALLATQRSTGWLIDGAATASFDPAGMAAVQGVLGVFRQAGGRRVAVVTSLPLVRLAAATAGLTLKLAVRVFGTRAGAERWLGVGAP